MALKPVGEFDIEINVNGTNRISETVSSNKTGGDSYNITEALNVAINVNGTERRNESITDDATYNIDETLSPSVYVDGSYEGSVNLSDTDSVYVDISAGNVYSGYVSVDEDVDSATTYDWGNYSTVINPSWSIDSGSERCDFWIQYNPLNRSEYYEVAYEYISPYESASGSEYYVFDGVSRFDADFEGGGGHIDVDFYTEVDTNPSVSVDNVYTS